MEFLDDIFKNVTSGWIGTILILMGAASFVVTVLTQAGGLFSTIGGWKVWQWIGRTIAAVWVRGMKRYRRWKAKRIMAAYFKQGEQMRIPRKAYEESLGAGTSESSLQKLAGLTLAGPRWLNDHYVSNALETLCQSTMVAKAHVYEPNAWRPRIVAYQFWLLNRDGQTADEFETDGMCRAYQGFHECPAGLRFDAQVVRETVSIREQQTRTYFPLKDAPPPCGRCWEKADRDRAVELLVNSITEHDLLESATVVITGENGEFQNAIISMCYEGQWEADIPTIKRVVSHAIEIRREQITKGGAIPSAEWTDRITAEFSDALRAFIRAELE